MKMKLFKRAAALLAAAVISAGCALAAHADSPPGAGTPSGADLILPGAAISQSVSNNPSTSTDAALSTTSRPTIEVSDKSFQRLMSYRGWKLWDGTSELLENTNYYIYGITSITGVKELPASSRLLVDEQTQLMLSSSCKFTVKGSLIVAPDSEVLCSGTFSVAENGLIDNFGNMKFTPNAVVNISSVFASYSNSQTALAGKTYVYSGGNLTSYGTVFVPVNSMATITGDWIVAESGRLYIGGRFTTTLSGLLDIKGYASIQEGCKVTNSGMLIIRTAAKYFVDRYAEVSNTQSGRFLDYNDPDFIYPEPDEPKPEEPEYHEPGIEEPPVEIPDYYFTEGIKGIDVSVWQGVIDWKRVKEAGIQFAIIRATSGPRVDKLFEYNITEAKNAGILVGVYHYCYALTPEEARQEAQHFINTISPYRIDYPVMFDFEDNSQAKLGREKLTQIAEAFLSEVKKAGYLPMIYSYRNWLQNNLNMDKLSEYEVAVAEWNVAEPKYDRPYGIWQYSCKGQISGIDGDVDLDICYKDYAKIIREGGYNRLK